LLTRIEIIEKPKKVDKELASTVQLIKDIGSNTNSTFTISKSSTFLKHL
jgi:hypothetical protein